MEHWIVYLYTNTINGKKYVGITRRGLSKRNFDHIKKAREGKGFTFHDAIRKYGINAFSLEAIACCWDIEGARITESAMIEVHRSFIDDNGYNLTRGGEVGFFTAEQREKIRQRMLGDKNPMRRPEVAMASSKIRKGIPSCNKGKKIAALSGSNNPFYGKRHPAEITERIASASRKRYMALFDNGSSMEILNLKEFCKENGCSYSGMRHMIADGKRYASKGFKVVRLD